MATHIVSLLGMGALKGWGHLLWMEEEPVEGNRVWKDSLGGEMGVELGGRGCG